MTTLFILVGCQARLPEGHHKRLGFYISMTPTNGTGDHLLTFVQQLHGHLKRPLLIIWGRFSGHKKAARLLQEVDSRRIQVAYLPAYAPDLNVVDHAWGTPSRHTTAPHATVAH